MLSEIVGTCICVSDYAAFLFWRLQRLFFLNGEQELSAFLLVDMGMVKYPKYECRRSRPVFATREDLLAYEEVIQMALTQVAFLSFMAPVYSQLNTSLFVILHY
jgi:Fanconi-associated nuclease 1